MGQPYDLAGKTFKLWNMLNIINYDYEIEDI